MIFKDFKTIYRYGDVFCLKPCADWHVGHRYHDRGALLDYLRAGYDDPKCYIVSVGDLADAIVVGDKRYVKSADGVMGQAILDSQMEDLARLLMPFKGRILGLGMGNHELTILKHHGSHLIRKLSEKLDTPSLGYQWMVRWRFFEDDGNGSTARVRTLLVYGHHGWGGGGRTAGASDTKYEKNAAKYIADIYLYGHDHKAKSQEIERMSVKGQAIVSNPYRLYFCGTFKKTFSATDEPTWEESRGFDPVPIRGLNIYIKPSRKWFEIWSDV